MAATKGLDSLILQEAQGIYKELFYNIQAADLGPKIFSSQPPATATLQKQHTAAKLNAAAGVLLQRATLEKLPPLPGAFSAPITIAAEAKLNSYLNSIRQHIKTNLEQKVSELSNPDSPKVLIWLRKITDEALIDQRTAYLAALGQITLTPKKKTGAPSTNTQLLVVKLQVEIQNLTRQRRKYLATQLNTTDPVELANLDKLLKENSTAILIKENALTRSLNLLRADKKPVIPIDTEYNAYVGNVTKNNKKVADTMAAANGQGVGKDTEAAKTPTIVIKDVVTPPIIFKSEFTVDKELLTAQGITNTTLNFFTGGDPLAAQIDTPTQLFDGDFTDARRNEAIMPMFFESEVPAYIKLMDDLGAPVDFNVTIIEDAKATSTSSNKPPTITDPFLDGARYNQFSLTSLQESHTEKYQIVDTMAQGQVIFSFDKKPRLWMVTGLVINDIYNNWLAKLREVWDNHLRIAKLVEKGKYARFVIPSQRIAFNGYPLDLNINHNAAMEMVPSFSMLIFVREYKNFTTFPFDAKSASATLISNLLWLDNVKQVGSATTNKTGTQTTTEQPLKKPVKDVPLTKVPVPSGTLNTGN